MFYMIWILLLLLETALFYFSLKQQNRLLQEKCIAYSAFILVLLLLFGAKILPYSFRFIPLMLWLTGRLLVNGFLLLKKKKRPFKKVKAGIRYTTAVFTLFLSLVPLLLFPPFDPLEASGSYEVETKKFTYTDQSRMDPFSDERAPRKVTVDYYYPKTGNGKFPLILFSHGAFGFSGSNFSTFQELASHGYIVGSISHTSHAFFTVDTKRTLTLADQDFLQKAVEINGLKDTSREEEVFHITKDWMKLRTEDTHFLLDTILSESRSSAPGLPFSLLDSDAIGLFGHSLGGASSAETARERNDVDAVIVLDGTMLGEEVDFKDGHVVLNDTPYPVPLLNVYAEDHYEGAMETQGDEYDNFYASAHALDARETVFRGTGHLNFTDLPLFSPILAEKLGIGPADARSAIVTMNEIVLEFFNSYLKNKGAPQIEKEYLDESTSAENK